MAQTQAGLKAKDFADARNVAERFMQAVQKGDEAAARSMIIVREGETLDFKTMHGSTTSFALGQPKAEGAVVVVEAKVEGPQAPPMPLPVVLTRADGSWKVDMGESIKRMMGGVDLEAMMKEMATGIGTAMAEGMGAVAEGLSSAMSGETPKPAKKAAKGKKKTKR